jgi:tetratricopeptide (TPR) repeat protein/4-amino-4-deoxy-L-arabinose transferase-like glycosyltransferase
MRWLELWQGERFTAALVTLMSALLFGLVVFLVFPADQQFVKYSLAATQIIAGTLPQERLLDFSPLYLQIHLLQARLFPGSSTFVAVLQIAAAAISSGMLYVLLQRSFGRGLAFAGVLAFALNRSLLAYTSLFEPEMLLLAFLLCFLLAMEYGGTNWTLAAGFALALALLTRPNLAPILFVVPFYLYLRYGSPKFRSIVAGFIFFPLLALLLLSVRHYKIEGGYSPLAMNPGFVFFEANNPLSTGQSAVVPPMVGQLMNEISNTPDNPHLSYRLLARRNAGEQLSTSDTNRYWASMAINYIAAHPWRWFRMELNKFFFIWHEYRRFDMLAAFNFNRVLQQKHIPAFPFALVSVLAMIGLIISKDEWRRYLLFYSVFAIQTAAMLVFYVSDRQRLLLLPILVFFACAGAGRFLTISKRMRFAAAGGIAVGSFLLSIPTDLMRDDPYIWDCDQRSNQYWMEAGRLRDYGNLEAAGRAAALSFASATWFEDYSRPANIPMGNRGFAARAVELWPELERAGASAEFDRGVLLLAAGDLEGAERIFSELNIAGRIFDRGYLQSSRPEFFLGRIAFRHGDTVQARLWLERGLVVAPGEPFILAHLAALTGKQEYLVSLQRYFGSIEADWQMGLALFEQGRPAEAVKYLERFVQAVPELRRGMIYLAVASGAAGETLQGADLYMRATANRPDPVMLEASVLKLFADLVRIQPDNAEAHYRHGIVLAQFGHFREGVAAVDRAFVLAPTEEIARSRVRLRGYLP